MRLRGEVCVTDTGFSVWCVFPLLNLARPVCVDKVLVALLLIPGPENDPEKAVGRRVPIRVYSRFTEERRGNIDSKGRRRYNLVSTPGMSFYSKRT